MVGDSLEVEHSMVVVYLKDLDLQEAASDKVQVVGDLLVVGGL